MIKSSTVTCPHCAGVLEIDLNTGKILQSWSPSDKSMTSEERMSSALKKIKDDKAKRATLFDEKKNEMDSQKKKSEDSFIKEVERLKKEGLKEKPQNPFDRD